MNASQTQTEDSVDAGPGRYSEQRRTEILRRIDELAPWYHKIDLGDGIVTPGREYDRIWNGTRRVLDGIDYNGRRVLDLASWDGMWAFEAERRGAATVVSTDVRLDGFPNLLFAREVLQSRVIPMCNVPVQDLQARLQVVRLDARFDIVHHLGLFYHLRDPMLSLAQVRGVMPEGGLLVLETAFIDDDEHSYMAFAGVPGDYHFYGVSDTWAPTRRCLREILQRSQFRPVHEERWQVVDQPNYQDDGIFKRFGRITLLAEAVAEDAMHEVELRKVRGIQ